MHPGNGGKFKILKYRELHSCSYDMTMGSQNGLEDKLNVSSSQKQEKIGLTSIHIDWALVS